MNEKTHSVKRVSTKSVTSEDFPIQKRCIYCGGPLPAKPLETHVHTRSFSTCNKDCQERTTQYVAADKKHKTTLYLLILLAAVLIFFAALSEGQMALSYLAMEVAGAAFLLFPYPISSFVTFLGCPIRTVKRICRVIGALFVAFGAVLIASYLF